MDNITVNPPGPWFNIVILNFMPTLILGQGCYNIDLGGGGVTSYNIIVQDCIHKFSPLSAEWSLYKI